MEIAGACVQNEAKETSLCCLTVEHFWQWGGEPQTRRKMIETEMVDVCKN